jgi:large conductance mechanosensitive channel
MLQEFKKFILRGNVVDLAVAVVIGAAFTAVVTAFVEDFLTPLIASVQGDREFAKYAFHLHGVAFKYGDFLNKLLTFLLTAGVVFFLVVQPLNHLMEMSKRRRRSAQSADPTTKECPECLSDVPVLAKRCKFCAVPLKVETKRI